MAYHDVDYSQYDYGFIPGSGVGGTMAGVPPPKWNIGGPNQKQPKFSYDQWGIEEKRLHDAYLEARKYAERTGDWTEAARIQQEQRNLKKFRADLGIFDAQQGQFTDELRRGFRTLTETTAAQQKRGLALDVGQYFSRRGLGESGFEGQGAVSAFGNLALGAQQSQNKFNNALSESLQAERAGFLQKEFTFFHALEQMRYATNLKKEIIEFQARMQKDAQSALRWDKMLELGGQVIGGAIGFAIGGPPGAVAGAAAGGSLTPSQNQGAYYNDNFGDPYSNQGSYYGGY